MYFKIIVVVFFVWQFVGCATTSKVVVKQESASVQQQRAQKAFDELDQETSPKEIVTPSVKKDAEPSKSVTDIKSLEKSVPDKVAEKGLEKSTKYPFEDGRPVWFYDPFYDGYLGALGIARKNAAKGGYAGQKRLAKTLAQAELAKQIKVFVSTELTTTRTSATTTSKDRVYENYKSTLSTTSVHKAEEIVRNAVIRDEWVDSNGDLYVWLVIEKE